MEYFENLACLVCIFSLAALSQCLMTGYTGIVFVGAAGFMGLGAYVSAWLALRHHIPALAAVTASALFCSLCGALLCAALQKLRRDYLALATLGIGLMLYDVFNNWEGLTNGPMGIAGLPPVIADPNWNLLGLASAVAASVAAVGFLGRSSFGMLLRAIRDDEELVQSMGRATFWPRVVVFAVSFFLLGLSGAWLGHYLSFIDPSSFGLGDSIAVLAMAIIGGAETASGAILGAAIYLLVPELLRFWGLSADAAAQARQALFGLLLVLLMIFRPQGLIGKYRFQ